MTLSKLSKPRKNSNHFRPLLVAGIVLLTMANCLPGANTYLVHNLVSDLPGLADHVDKNLLNPWGNGFSATGPFWIGNNHSGTSTLYDGTGTALPLVVSIPAAGGASSPGSVTGVLANGSATAFNVAPGKPASFLFCTEDGTISGWNTTVDATHAKVLVDNSKSKAVYKGCALGGSAVAPVLYAANFSSGAIDVFDGTFTPLQVANAFVDPLVPAGFAPFNIQNLGGKLYVAYAKPNAEKQDDVPGLGNGYVAVFDMNGTLQTTLISQGPLNSPWGLAIAPATFGDFANALLVGNFGDGTIHAFNTSTGALMGTLNNVKGTALTIPGLWALNFGNGGRAGDAGTLYFTAGSPGPNNEALETHGLFGSVQAAPSFTTSNILNGASFSATIAPNSWVTIKGSGLAATTRNWQASDFTGGKLPTQLDGVGVTVNGEAAYVSYISPTQINFLVPSDIVAGPVQIQTTNNGLTSATLSATLLTAAPSFFISGTANGNQYIAATHADNSLTGPPSLIAGATTTPVKPGETIVLYGNGFGATSPIAPLGQVVSTPVQLVALPAVSIGGQPAQVTFAGLVAPGLYQLNVVVPASLRLSGTAPNLDVPVVVQASGGQSQANAFISVVNTPQ